MQPISILKENQNPGTPLLLFQVSLTGGVTLYWSMHKVSLGGRDFEGRVLDHGQLEFRLNGGEGGGSAQRFQFMLANADQALSGFTRDGLWRGAKLKVSFVLFDLVAGVALSPEAALFQGLISAPEEQTPLRLKLVAFDRFATQRLALPSVRIQRQCPWAFPRTLVEREEAVNGGSRGQYSLFYKCGYSADVAGGVGNLNVGAAFTSCDYSRTQCEERGMFDRDSLLRPTKRFGGIEFVPASVLVRGHGDRAAQLSVANPNEGKYNNPVPMIYGTVWYEPPVVLSRSDGNLLRTEVLLGCGPLAGVVKLFANGTEIPRGVAGKDMTATGWFEEFALGERVGGFNADFSDGAGNPQGDPYGSMAALSVVVPLGVARGTGTPKVEALVQGMKLPQYGVDGSYSGQSYTTNPAWVLLDLLRRSGWADGEVDPASFARAAVQCGEAVAARDAFGNEVFVPRAECNLALTRRRSLPELLAGVQSGSGLHLRFNLAGKVECVVESTLASQQPVKPEGSNAAAALAGGWPAYEFGDGAEGRGGIALDESGVASLRLWGMAAVDTPNRAGVEFQDSLNVYRHDSLTVIDIDGSNRAGYEIAATLPALGIGNRHQAHRMASRFLKKAGEGNLFCELTTTIKGFFLRPNDLITVSYQRYGLDRELFRVVSVAPGANHRKVRIVARKHSDGWYGDGGFVEGGLNGSGRVESGGVPRPVLGMAVSGESAVEGEDGRVAVWLSADFQVPSVPAAARLAAPFVSLSAGVNSSGGSLAGGRVLFYAVSAVGTDGVEGDLSLTIRSVLPAGGSTYRVQLSGLRFPPGAASMNVYRGENSRDLRRVAAGAALAGSFEDAGLAATAIAAPDANFDHARFEIRSEYLPGTPVTAAGVISATVGSVTFADDELAGMIAVVSAGMGAGQERRIVGNAGGVIEVDGAWDAVPDLTSELTVVEGEWQVAARSQASPVRFEVPNRQGLAVQIRAIGVSAAGVESPKGLAEVARWIVNGGAAGGTDTDVPPLPVFALSCPGDGTARLGAIGFSSLENTGTIEAGTLTLYSWRETDAAPALVLAAGVTSAETTLSLGAALNVDVGDLLLVGAEIVRAVATSAGTTVTVARGVLGTAAAGHAAGGLIYPLGRRTEVLAFGRDFFGSPASGAYSHTVLAPGVRIAAAQLFMTNRKGNSETAAVNFTGTVERGLRTLNGGQISLQVAGHLAIQTNAAAPFIVDRAYPVRDIFASVQQAPTGAPVVVDVKVDGTARGTLTIAAGATISNSISGAGLPAFQAMERVTLDIVSLGQSFDMSPGKDLTVTIRL